MKLKCLIPILTLAVFTTGCDKNKIEEINVNVTNSQTYHYDFGICGDEEGVSIVTPPAHAETCSILRDSTTQFCCQLEYKASAGYTGSDFVEVQTNTGSNGASEGELNTIRFNFTVTN